MRTCIAATAIAALAANAHAQWTYSVLNPPGQAAAGIYTVGPGMAAGFTGPFSSAHAVIWPSLSSSNAIDVTPAGATESQITGTNGTQHVGNTVISGVRRASLWNGSTFTSLHPSGYSLSYANDTDGTHQFGFARDTGGNDHAFMWSGTAASGVNMDPPGARASRIFATAAGRQVGDAEYPPPDLGNRKAGYWTGTAASFTLLPLPANTVSSDALAISPDGQSFGGEVLNSAQNTAFLWLNGGATLISLHPAGATNSGVSAMDNHFQVGAAGFGFGDAAALWQGSAASFVNLSSFLPANYGNAGASGVYSTAADVWVGGYAFNTTTSTYQAIVWHNTIPAPGSSLVLACAVGAALRRRRRAGSPP
jgi:hypothetical protein